eukprot:68848_1
MTQQTHNINKHVIEFIMEVTNKQNIDLDIQKIMANMIKTSCQINTTICPQPLKQVLCSLGSIQAIINQNTPDDIFNYNELIIPIKIVKLSANLSSHPGARINDK